VRNVAEVVRDRVAGGEGAVVGRIIEMKGFSTLAFNELIAIDDDGTVHGEILGRYGAEKLKPVAASMLAGGGPTLEQVFVEIHGPAVADLGLSCGGRAEVLLQPASAIPQELWALLAGRAPVALVTRISGAGRGPAALVVDREGRRWGGLEGPPEATEALAATARSLLSAGRPAMERVEDEAGVALLEAWVPQPRLVVVGGGEAVGAIKAQAGLLGWETSDTDALRGLDGMLDWAGATAALIVLSHDPHVDVPALAAGLARRLPYVGAMGSRGTQSRRATRLAETGVTQAQIDSIRRPIGLNLGGRRAPEVALAIVAEILACHCGRDGRPLRETGGPIHG